MTVVMFTTYPFVAGQPDRLTALHGRPRPQRELQGLVLADVNSPPQRADFRAI
jgi:hypothetical protein